MGEENDEHSKYNFRKAVKEDIESIKALHHGRKDIHYVDFALKQSFKSPHFFCFVVMENENVIAAAIFHVLSGGDTTVSCGFYINPDHQGRKLPQQLCDYGSSEILRIFPRAFTYYMYTEFDNPAHSYRLMKHPQIYTTVLRRRVLSLTTNISVVKNFVSSLSNNNVGDIYRTLSTDNPSKIDFIKELQTLEVSRRLFPEGYIMSRGQPFKTTLGDLNVLYDGSDVIWDRKEGHVCAISFVTCEEFKTDMHINVDLHGEMEIRNLQCQFLSVLCKVDQIEDVNEELRVSILICYPFSCRQLELNDLFGKNIHWQEGTLSRHETLSLCQKKLVTL